MTDADYELAHQKMREEIKESVQRRFEQLNGIVLDTVTEGLKFLTLVHLGGMGGVLSFMGAVKGSNPWLVSAFVCFFVGACCVGLTYLLRYFHMTKLLDKYLGDVDAHYSDPDAMHWGKVVQRDKQRVDEKFDFALCTAILSLLAFGGGGLSSFFGVAAYIKQIG